MNWINITFFLIKAGLFTWLFYYQIKKYVNFLDIARTRTTFQKNWKHWTEHVVRPLLMVITCGLMIFFLYVFRQPETWINDWNDKRETEEVEGVYEEGDEKEKEAEKEIEQPKVEKPEVEAPAVEPPSSNAEENNSFEQENDSLKSVIDELKNELKKVAKKPQPKPKKNKSGRTGYIWKG